MAAKVPTIVVTGGAKRIGAEICRYFAKKGWQVGIHYRNSKDEAEGLSSELMAEFQTKTHLVQADLAQLEGCKAVVAEFKQALGPIDLWVNSASIYLAEAFETLPAQAMMANWAINYAAPVRLIAAYAQIHDSGHIVNMTDANCGRYGSEYLAYEASKLGLERATVVLAKELAPSIRVNAVAPGWILDAVGVSQDAVQARIKSIPMGRRGTPEDICKAIEFLHQSDYVTGSVIPVDGGASI